MPLSAPQMPSGKVPAVPRRDSPSPHSRGQGWCLQGPDEEAEPWGSACGKQRRGRWCCALHPPRAPAPKCSMSPQAGRASSGRLLSTHVCVCACVCVHAQTWVPAGPEPVSLLALTWSPPQASKANILSPSCGGGNPRGLVTQTRPAHQLCRPVRLRSGSRDLGTALRLGRALALCGRVCPLRPGFPQPSRPPCFRVPDTPPGGDSRYPGWAA